MKYYRIKAAALIMGAIAGLGTTGLAQQTTPQKDKQPMFLSEIRRNVESKSTTVRAPARGPARVQERSGSRTEAEQSRNEPVGSQISFFELSPSIGAISIKDKSAFTLGANLSFLVSENSSAYFEPSVLMSFLSGDDNRNATIFHLDAGLRYDLVIEGSALVPFLKGAIGPSLSTQSNVTINGSELSDSYVNVFAGGGLRVLISPRVAARFDTGLTFQATDPGLYVAGSAVFPL